MPIQLSISLLISDRLESLERCLDSLRPLLMQIPSELIVVFTGKDKRIYELASQYTDQIISFDWCDDFSAARNAGLKVAKGEWFLYIDDDEWFEDISEIRDFFLSGSYRNYGSACYIQRNFTDWNGRNHIDYRAFRMSRIIPGIRFINPIHEELEPMPEPCKYFDAYVHHYGYASNIKRDDYLKPSRNIPLLLKNIKERPTYMKNYLQLVQEYAAAENWEKAEEYCQEGLKRCRNCNAYHRWLQSNLAVILLKAGDNVKTKRVLSHILDNEYPCELVQLILFNTMIKLSSQQNAFEETVQYGTQFERVLNYMDQKPELWEEQSYCDLNKQKVKNPYELLKGRMCCAEAALELGDPDKAEFFLNLLSWEEDYLIQEYYPTFDVWKRKYPFFLNLLKAIPFNSPYLSLQRIVVCEDSATKKRLLTAYAENAKTIYLQLQIIKEAVHMKIDLAFIAGILDLDTWKQCTEELIKTLSASDSDALWDLSDMLMKLYPLQGTWLKKLHLERRLTHGLYLDFEFINLLAQYCSIVLHFYKELYQENMFIDERQIFLPKDYQFAFLVSKSLEKIKENDFSEAVRLFHSSIHYKPEMTGVINEVLRQMKKWIDDPGRNSAEEYQTLAIQLKKALATLIKQEKYTDALSIIPQMTALLPTDLELLRIKQQLLHQAQIQ